MSRASDGILRVPITFVRERLGLSPNQLSACGFGLGLAAAALVAAGFLAAGLIVLALSQIVDGLDGGVARRYGLQSERGRKLEVMVDRLSELAILLALAWAGYAAYSTAALAFLAILLVTVVEPYSHFDPGFKRFVIYFGYAAMIIFKVRGFEIALQAIFLANLIAFAIGTVLADYSLQEEIDRQAVLRRERELAMGIAQPPDDPPSLLSRLFS